VRHHPDKVLPAASPAAPCAAQTQSEAVRIASLEGGKAAITALAASSAVVLGACKLFPRFNRSLSVSGKTALIVSQHCWVLPCSLLSRGVFMPF
jgi:hypothetical protein